MMSSNDREGGRRDVRETISGDDKCARLDVEEEPPSGQEREKERERALHVLS